MGRRKQGIALFLAFTLAVLEAFSAWSFEGWALEGNGFFGGREDWDTEGLVQEEEPWESGGEFVQDGLEEVLPASEEAEDLGDGEEAFHGVSAREEDALPFSDTQGPEFSSGGEAAEGAPGWPEESLTSLAYFPDSPTYAVPREELGGIDVDTYLCTVDAGTNVEQQGYVSWTRVIRSYLSPCADGTLMRVQYVESRKCILIEYYDEHYRILPERRRELTPSLPIFGGFYDDGEHYYLLTGQENFEESDEKTVYRLDRYSRDWAPEGALEISGVGTVDPFSFAAARFATYGRYLLIRTCRRIYAERLANGEIYYVDGEKVYHQTNIGFVIDRETMELVHKDWAYVSHSLNQFVLGDHGEVIGLDQSDSIFDGDPERGLVLSAGIPVEGGSIDYSHLYHTVLKAPREEDIAYQYTGMSVGGFEQLSGSYVLAGNQDVTYGQESRRNIFVALVDREDYSVSVKYLTDVAEGESCSTPHLVKLSDQQIMVLWSWAGRVYYCLVGPDGGAEGEIHSLSGNLSDCAPVAAGGRVIWYTWADGRVVFYEIPLGQLSAPQVYVIENGHRFAYSEPDNGCLQGTCTGCGFQQTFAAPIHFDTFIYRYVDEEYHGFDYSYRPSDGEYLLKYHRAGDTFRYLAMELSYSRGDLEKLSEMTAVSSNEEVLQVAKKEDVLQTDFGLLAVDKGKATLTVSSRYNPACQKTFDFYVNTLTDEDAVLAAKDYPYEGKPVEPEVSVSYIGEELTAGVDYETEYSSNEMCGVGKVLVRGIGAYTGQAEQSFTISQGKHTYTYSEPKKGIVTGTCQVCGYSQEFSVPVSCNETIYAKPYEGFASEYEVRHHQAGEELGIFLWDIQYADQKAVPCAEYTASSSNEEAVEITHVDVWETGFDVKLKAVGKGSSTIELSSRSNPEFCYRETFFVNTLSEEAVTITNPEETFIRGEKEPEVRVTYFGRELKPGEDYTAEVLYPEGKKKGTVLVQGIGAYTGGGEKSFSYVDPSSAATPTPVPTDAPAPTGAPAASEVVFENRDLRLAAPAELLGRYEVRLASSEGTQVVNFLQNGERAFSFFVSPEYPSLEETGVRLLGILRTPNFEGGEALYFKTSEAFLDSAQAAGDREALAAGLELKGTCAYAPVNTDKLPAWRKRFYQLMIDGRVGGALVLNFASYPGMKFRLLNVDGGSIPELLCYIRKKTNGIRLISFDGEKLCKSTMPYGTVHYIKKGNSIYVHSELSKVVRDYTYVMKNGKLSARHKGVAKSASYSYEDAAKLTWDGKKTTAQRYVSLLHSAFDFSRQRKLPKARTRKQIQNYLLFKDYN